MAAKRKSHSTPANIKTVPMLGLNKDHDACKWHSTQKQRMLPCDPFEHTKRKILSKLGIDMYRIDWSLPGLFTKVQCRPPCEASNSCPWASRRVWLCQRQDFVYSHVCSLRFRGAHRALLACSDCRLRSSDHQ